MWFTKQRILEKLKKMTSLRLYLTRLCMPFVFMLAFLPASGGLSGSLPDTAELPTRIVSQTVTLMASHWRLLQWSDGKPVCDLILKHDKWPDHDDVTSSCGVGVWEKWTSTPTCSTGTCQQGLFLRYINQAPREFVETVTLPEIEVRLSPVGCTPGEWCATRPIVEMTAVDLLGGYEISSVHFRAGMRETIFDGDGGRYILPLTGQDGDWLDYWAESTFGDRSLPVRIKYRSFMSKEGDSFHFDLLGAEWKSYLPGGSLSWGVFPPLDGTLPVALVQPKTLDGLSTADAYLYLSGYLIQSGQVDASSCSDGGLYLGGSASPCGEEAARPATITWQNKYDDQILQAALKYNVPARLLKAVIAQESQFWPDTRKPFEKGLGYITENGVDMLLNWNIPYYLEICQPLYQEGICSYGYSSIREVRQVMLRKVVLDKVGSPDEIDILAAMLLASADQSGQVVQNMAGQEIVYVAGYVDMWKIATGNYYAGAGCMADAIEIVLDNEEALTWQNIADQLSPVCKPADMYVRQIFEKASAGQ
jgi:hypothetical protein